MSNAILNTAESPSTLEEKLHACVQRMIELALDLRKAITARSSERIWQVLADQEEQALLLDEYSKLWNEMNECRSKTDPALSKTKRRIRLDIQRLQASQKANAMLAQGFLSAIRKSVGQNARDRGAVNVYNRRGRMGSGASSVLVKRMG